MNKIINIVKDIFASSVACIVISAVIILTVVYGAALASPPPADYNTDRILTAIREVETGGHKDPANAVGDNGKSIGPFQIGKPYWKDATSFDESIGGVYTDCKDEVYARRIVIAYLSRYSKEWTDENAARIHNGGGGILKKKDANTGTGSMKAWDNTTKYWNKVNARLKVFDKAATKNEDEETDAQAESRREKSKTKRNKGKSDDGLPPAPEMPGFEMPTQPNNEKPVKPTAPSPGSPIPPGPSAPPPASV